MSQAQLGTKGTHWEHLSRILSKTGGLMQQMEQWTLPTRFAVKVLNLQRFASVFSALPCPELQAQVRPWEWKFGYPQGALPGEKQNFIYRMLHRQRSSVVN